MSPIFEYNFGIVKKIKTWENLHKIIQKNLFRKHMEILKDVFISFTIPKLYSKIGIFTSYFFSYFRNKDHW